MGVVSKANETVSQHGKAKFTNKSPQSPANETGETEMAFHEDRAALKKLLQSCFGEGKDS